MRSSLVVACGLLVLASRATLAGSPEVELPDTDERAAVRRLIDRFQTVEKVERKQGVLAAIHLRGLPEVERASFRMLFDPGTGKVVQVRGNRAAFTNDEWQLLAPLSELRVLSLHHNFGANLKDRRELYDGGGLTALKGNQKLEEVTLPGSPFGTDGLKAVAELPQVKGLGIWHVAVEDADFEVLRGHPNLEWVRVAPMWSPKITDKALQHLAHCPKLKSVRLSESYVTWEGGLRHLLRRKATLKELDLKTSVVAPEDLARFRKEMPDVAVEHAGVEEVGRLIVENFKGAGRKLPKWVPAAVLDRYRAAAER